MHAITGGNSFERKSIFMGFRLCVANVSFIKDSHRSLATVLISSFNVYLITYISPFTERFIKISTVFVYK